MNLQLARLKRPVILAGSLLAVVATTWGIRSALRSPLFLVRIVEVADYPEDAPVDAQAVSDLAAVPLKTVNLFDLDLKSIESRVLTNPWIREVRLVKRFPQTLSISVTFREPRAVVQSAHGALSYVDAEGKLFGRVDFSRFSDLPILSGGKLQDSLRLLLAWETSGLGRLSQLSSITWDQERGFRALAVYPLQGVDGSGKARTLVELGQETNTSASDETSTIESQFDRLSHVFKHLSHNAIVARQIFADAGKKIVVKTARGS